MATIMNQNARMTFASRSTIQKTCIVLGAFFVLAGLVGIAIPGFMGMHLSLSHNLIHLASGFLALAMGFGENSKSAYAFSICFGAVYGLLGIAGFVVGRPGYPGVGHMSADQNLFIIVPNVLEFGTMDHFVHLILSAAFLFSALAWKKTFYEADRALVDIQRRRDRV